MLQNIYVTVHFVPQVLPIGEISSCVGFLNFSSILVPSLAEILWPLDILRPCGLSPSTLDVLTVGLNGVLFELPWDRIVAV